MHNAAMRILDLESWILDRKCGETSTKNVTVNEISLTRRGVCVWFPHFTFGLRTLLRVCRNPCNAIHCVNCHEFSRGIEPLLGALQLQGLDGVADSSVSDLQYATLPCVRASSTDFVGYQPCHILACVRNL